MITAAQIRAARALVSMDQRTLADLAGLSLPTIQRMEASEGVVRGTVVSLMKLMGALESAGVEFLAESAASAGGGRGVRLKQASAQPLRSAGSSNERGGTGSAGPQDDS